LPDIQKENVSLGCALFCYSEAMKRLYLFTLEIVPLEVGGVYDDLPSHLTLMSRFLSDLAPEDLARRVRPLFAKAGAVHLLFGETMTLGPKKVTAHMVDSPAEKQLHNSLRELLNGCKAKYQYPEFIGDNHKAHVTERPGVQFAPGSGRVASAVYLIEIVHGKRVVQAKFELGVS